MKPSDPKDPSPPQPILNDDKDPRGAAPEPPDPSDGDDRAPGVSGLVDQPITMTITVTGPKMEINGPLHDMIFCYGVLERAKDIIRQMHQQRQGRAPDRTPSGLVIPKMGLKPRDPRGS